MTTFRTVSALGLDVFYRGRRSGSPKLLLLGGPHAHRVQLDLFYDYRTNAALYETWQQRMRDTQPSLIFWARETSSSPLSRLPA